MTKGDLVTLLSEFHDDDVVVIENEYGIPVFGIQSIEQYSGDNEVIIRTCKRPKA